jgi:hypothetical protein
MTEASRARYLSENTPAADPLLLQRVSPSIELRNKAAELHEAMTKAEDQARDVEDELIPWKQWGVKIARDLYEGFCEEHGFALKTDASRLCLYCAETGIPLVIGDEYDELETGECVLVKRAA